MDVGYLPDMFGHVAQMPQLLQLAGFDHAVVWRGVPASVEQTAFWWEAPDGSRVRAEYLYGSYSNGRDLPDDAKGLVLRAVDYEQELGAVRLGDMLLMNGTDHQMPQPWLGRVVAEANAAQDDYEFVVTSLPEYLPAQPTAGLATVRGELRSGARANLLMGVASNRVDVHRACAAAERALEKRAEPLSALFLPAERYPHAFATIAWRNLVLNSAHDSSCACSHDEVVDQVVVRYAEARQIGEGLARDAVHALAGTVDAPRGATLVVNPTARARTGVVEVRVPGRGPCVFVDALGVPRPTQLLEETGGESRPIFVTGQKVRGVVNDMRGTEFQGRQIASYDVHDLGADAEVDVALHEAMPGEERCDLVELKEQLLAFGKSGRDLRIRLVAAPARRVLFDTGDIDGFGWACFTARDDAQGGTHVVRALANEHLHVEVDTRDGVYALERSDGLRVADLGQLVDGGDGGDTYNYSPPRADLVVDQPDAGSVRVTTLEDGPVRARVAVDAIYTLPSHAVGDWRACTSRSDETVAVPVRTTLELRAGERFLRVRHDIDNQARDHRLRADFPLPGPVRGSDAECAFAVVRRGLTAEGGAHEYGLPTFPSRRFVDASDVSGTQVGLALIHDGLLEYEVVAGGTTLALTILRAVGYLSRTEPALRPNPAGPADRLDGAQLIGAQRAEYAVMPHRGDWRAADCYGAADAFTVPLERGARHDSRRGDTAVDGERASCRRRGGVGGVARPGWARRARVPYRRRRRPGHDRA